MKYMNFFITFLFCIFISNEICFAPPRRMMGATSSASEGGRSSKMGMSKMSAKSKTSGGSSNKGKALGASKLMQNDDSDDSDDSGDTGDTSTPPDTPPTPPSTPFTPPNTPSMTTPPAETTSPAEKSTRDKSADVTEPAAVDDASSEEITTADQHEANVKSDENIMQKLKAINEQDITNKKAVEKLSYKLLFNNFDHFKDFIVTNFTKQQFLLLSQEFINQIYPVDSDDVVNFGTSIMPIKTATTTLSQTPTDDTTTPDDSSTQLSSDDTDDITSDDNTISSDAFDTFSDNNS